MFPRVPHPSATRSEDPVRLACVKPAASVRSEPGSNSHVQEFFPEITSSLDEVHSNRNPERIQPKRSFYQETCLPDLALLSTQQTLSGPSRTECPKRRPRFSFFLFTCQRTEGNSAPLTHRPNPSAYRQAQATETRRHHVAAAPPSMNGVIGGATCLVNTDNHEGANFCMR